MKAYNKLVRDKIPEIISLDKKHPVVWTLDEEEKYCCLRHKLLEEVQEFLEDENAEELADIKEVILEIMKMLNISAEEVEEKRVKKFKERGGFSEGVYLVGVYDENEIKNN